jgi:FlaA1/EpsC-like NDP-sugar epimerase
MKTAADAPGPWQRLDRLLARLRRHREPLSLLVDAAVVALCWNATYLFRLGFERWFAARADYDPLVMAVVVLVYGLVFAALRVHRGLWRFSGFGEVQRFALACVLAGTVCGIGVLALGLVKIPRSVLALHPIVTLMGVALVRMLYRMFYEHLQTRLGEPRGEAKRAIVLGAGAAARLLLAGLRAQGWTVLGLLDDDPLKQGAVVAGVTVLGPLDLLPHHVETRKASGRPQPLTHVVVAMPSATRAQRRRALDIAAATGLPVLTVPSADELRSGSTSVERLRDIEPEDLLGRESVQLDETPVAAVLQGRTVLVTGAGGSIGSELVRQVARFAPARVVLVELSEYNLYAIAQELAEARPGLRVEPLIGDVKDSAWLHTLMQRTRPAVVFHAAAYKHVPLMEGANAAAALANNVLGTLHCAEAAALAGVERFVLISTDKAVNPTNVMGASKRAAELVLQALAAQHSQTRFVTVRFGNVLGSSGSVIPRFKEQIARGGPVTVTHPDIIRYFMTIPEAARLVLQAAAIGASGQVLVLDMGEPVRIVDLARDLIRLAGHTTDEIAIEFTGLRPGEKLFEELLADSEATLPTPVQRLHVARITSGLRGDLAGWTRRAEALEGDEAAARALLREWVPEYRAAADNPAASLPTPSDTPAPERA